jgi:hypothetical protein
MTARIANRYLRHQRSGRAGTELGYDGRRDDDCAANSRSARTVAPIQHTVISDSNESGATMTSASTAVDDTGMIQ